MHVICYRKLLEAINTLVEKARIVEWNFKNMRVEEMPQWVE